jgi:uncharacterized protein YciI
MYIIELTYLKPLTEADKYLEEHKAYLNKYYGLKKFLLSGRKDPRTGGIIFTNAKSGEEIRDIISEDPFHKNGVAEYNIIEFFPSMAHEDLRFLLQTTGLEET